MLSSGRDYASFLSQNPRDYYNHITLYEFFTPLTVFYKSLNDINLPEVLKGGCPRGVMVKATDCGIVVSEFVLQSRYYIHFRANTLGKVMNPLILPLS